MATINEQESYESTTGSMTQVDAVDSVDNVNIEIRHHAIKETSTQTTTRSSKMTWSTLLVALLGLVVVVSGALLFMAMVGMIQFESKETLAYWIEVNSQILNAIFTLAAVTSQPMRFACLYYLSGVISLERRIDQFPLTRASSHTLESPFSETKSFKIPPELQSMYEKVRYFSNRLAKHFPNILIDKRQSSMGPITSTRTMLIILILLNLNCITQYPITAVMWIWASNPTSRPSLVVFALIPVSFGTGTVGSILLAVHQRRLKRLRSFVSIVPLHHDESHKNTTNALHPSPPPFIETTNESIRALTVDEFDNVLEMAGNAVQQSFHPTTLSQPQPSPAHYRCILPNYNATDSEYMPDA